MFNFTPDIFNGLFEFIGGCFLCLNLKNLYRDKVLKGVAWQPTVFMSSWGVWNLYYYPSLNQWWSFWGGLWIVSVNTIWLTMILYYYLQRKKVLDISRYEAEWREAVSVSSEAMLEKNRRKQDKKANKAVQLATEGMTDKEWAKMVKKIRKAQKNAPKPTFQPRGGLIRRPGLSRRVLK